MRQAVGLKKRASDPVAKKGDAGPRLSYKETTVRYNKASLLLRETKTVSGTRYDGLFYCVCGSDFFKVG